MAMYFLIVNKKGLQVYIYYLLNSYIYTCFSSFVIFNQNQSVSKLQSIFFFFKNFNHFSLQFNIQI